MLYIVTRNTYTTKRRSFEQNFCNKLLYERITGQRCIKRGTKRRRTFSFTLKCDSSVSPVPLPQDGKS